MLGKEKAKGAALFGASSVWGSGKNHREASWSIWTVNVRCQRYTIPHRHSDVELHPHFQATLRCFALLRTGFAPNARLERGQQKNTRQNAAAVNFHVSNPLDAGLLQVLLQN
jgi:hypothetical protein